MRCPPALSFSALSWSSLYARNSRVAPSPAPPPSTGTADSPATAPAPAAPAVIAADSTAAKPGAVGTVPVASAAPAPKKPEPSRATPTRPAAGVSDSAVSPRVAGARAPIEALARAIESRDIARVQAAWPGLTDRQRTFWTKNVFELAEMLRATVQYTGASLRPGGAEVDFTLRVRFRYRSGETGALRPQRLHAVLSRRDGAWQIDQLTER